jgi:hypothetical protein
MPAAQLAATTSTPVATLAGSGFLNKKNGLYQDP